MWMTWRAILNNPQRDAMPSALIFHKTAGLAFPDADGFGGGSDSGGFGWIRVDSWTPELESAHGPT